MVGFGDPAHHTGAFGFVLGGYLVCASPDDTGWYHKAHPTFADALALVRKELWANSTLGGSHPQIDTIKIPRAFMEHLTQTLCYAA